MKTLYKNRLPHIAPLGATFFVTFRLADSLPITIIQSLKAEFEQKCQQLKKEKPPNLQARICDERKRYFGKFDHQLDTLRYGNCYLNQPEIAQIVVQKLHEFDKVHYHLHAYCIMPNHVHVLLDTSQQLIIKEEIFEEDAAPQYVQLHDIMRLIKGGSARFANVALGRKGTFWMKDSYDHYVRNEEE